MMRRRVVITGLGVLTCNASNVDEFRRALHEGRDGLGPITQFDIGRYKCNLAGEIRHEPEAVAKRGDLDRASALALYAARQALDDAGLPWGDAESREGVLGVVVGTTCGGVHSLEKVADALASDDESSIPTRHVTEMTFSAATEHIAECCRADGPVLTVAVACASGTNAIGVATDLIRLGRADIVLAGGFDVISRFIYRGFAALSGLGTAPYRAFDKNRAGVILGEGAGFLVLESRERALQRSARVYAEVLGHGANNDGCFIVNPNPTGEGIARAMTMALEDAALEPEAIDQFNAHGTGTQLNDTAETAGLHRVFGSGTKLPVASIKPMIGHTSGAAGAIEAIASVMSLLDDFVPPTLGFETPDPACAVNVSAEPRPLPTSRILSANSGFGGSNASLVLGTPLADGDGHACPSERVVVTGMGLMAPGIDSPHALWERLAEGGAPSPAAEGWVRLDDVDFFRLTGTAPTRNTRRMDAFSRIAATAAHRALGDAGIDETRAEQTGLVVGSAFACLESNQLFAAGLSKKKVNPVVYQNTVSNALTGYFGMLFRLRGMTTVFNQGWISGLAALGYAADLVKTGRCRAVLVGGVERLCTAAHLFLEREGLLVSASEDTGKDDSHGGFIPADGAAFLVVESLASAKERGAAIHGEVLEYGHVAPFGKGAVTQLSTLIRRLLEEGRCAGRSLHVQSSISGIDRLDRIESAALESAFAGWKDAVSISSLHRVTGHLLGASGLLSSIAALHGAARRAVAGAPVSLWEDASPLHVPREKTARDIDRIIVTSLDRDASAAAVCFGMPGPADT